MVVHIQDLVKGQTVINTEIYSRDLIIAASNYAGSGNDPELRRILIDTLRRESKKTADNIINKCKTNHL